MAIEKVFTDAIPIITIIGGMVHIQNEGRYLVAPISAFTAFINAGRRAIADWQGAEQSGRAPAIPMCQGCDKRPH